ncbi:septum site-determining protein MinC [Psychromonas antarctica]|uniref:septum site-determining protein MinC n=1 Tax=Psychromonas antarctica TaxID=67573 RepID=UPI001EE986D2|nr:septum site-determining protein MinC [Psychromonas antarctica]MCG6199941.1 septum site-determining protein MinC [Psychromonas antarctica]
MTLKSLNFTLLVVNIDSDELSLLSEELNKKRMMAPDFFSDAPVVVKVESETLNLDYLQLKQRVNDQGFILLGITGDLSDLQKEQIKAQKIAILKSSKRVVARNKVEIDSANKTVEVERRAFVPVEVKTKIHTGRVRSGQQIYAKECDLVINGDVGAGAEVIADGNIHIYGALRGKALAGAMGEKSACIFCQSLSSELVSIAGVYKLSDDLAADFVGKGCIVSLQDEQIVLSNLSRV